MASQNSTNNKVLDNVFTVGGDIRTNSISFQSTSHKLNFYEEDDWTPVLSFGGGTSGLDYTSSGRFIRVGHLVVVTLEINLVTIGSSSGSLLISGLPYNPDIINISELAISGVPYCSNIQRRSTEVSSYWFARFIAGPSIQIYENRTGGVFVVRASEFTDDSIIKITMPYRMEL